MEIEFYYACDERIETIRSGNHHPPNWRSPVGNQTFAVYSKITNPIHNAILLEAYKKQMPAYYWIDEIECWYFIHILLDGIRHDKLYALLGEDNIQIVNSVYLNVAVLKTIQYEQYTSLEDLQKLCKTL